MLITAAIASLFLFLFFVIWFRFNAEKQSIRAMWDLTDAEKSYINVVLQKGRLEPCEVEAGDEALLGRLEDSEWLFQLTDGAWVADTKVHYFEKAFSADDQGNPNMKNKQNHTGLSR